MHSTLRETALALSRASTEVFGEAGNARWPTQDGEGYADERAAAHELDAVHGRVSRLAFETGDLYSAATRSAVRELGLLHWGLISQADDVDGAVDLLAHVEREITDANETPYDLLSRFIEASQVLQGAFRAQVLRLQRLEAQLARMPNGGPEGVPLVDGEDGGGRQPYLKGEPVNAEAGHYLRSRRGGRFKRGRNGAPDFAFLQIPSSPREVILEVDPAMRFAWPAEVER